MQDLPVNKPITHEEPVRPPSTDPLKVLPMTVGASLKSSIESKLKQLELDDQNQKDGRYNV